MYSGSGIFARSQKSTTGPVDLRHFLRIESAPDGDTISAMLDRGDLDGFMAPRPPSGKNPDVGWLFSDPTEEAKGYYRRTKVFRIMHVVEIRKTLVEAHPWLPAAVLKAFEHSKRIALERLSGTSATKVTLPFVEEQLKAARELLGDDHWSYGIKPNLNTLGTFLRHHRSQDLSKRQLTVQEVFHPSTWETAKI
ncbi:MAG: 4,5-dihydroxyphthalate decarboxylase [Caballeronia sp.]|nr:4,5-dihydroxyphthalate decarboxylase [Caballeronia sp.]